MLSGAWGIASGAALAILGIATMRAGRARAWGAFAFSLFLVLWGTHVTVGNLARFSDSPETVETISLLMVATLLPLPYLLVSFAARQVGRARRAWRALPPVLATASLVVGALIALDPALALGGVSDEAGVVRPQWGVAYFPLVVAFFAAFGVALVALARAKLDAPTPRTAARFALLFAGLGIYVAFTAGNSLAFYASALWTYGYDGRMAGLAVLFGALALLCALLAARELRHARASDAVTRRASLWTAAALLAPLAYGAIEGVLAVVAFPLLLTVGLWRLVASAVIVFGLAQWGAPELREKARRAATVSAGAAGVGAAGAGAWGATALVLPNPVLPILAAGFVGAALTFPTVRAVRRWLDATPAPAVDTDAAYGERIESYRAALEASVARGTLDEDREFLAALRDRFGIGDEAHRVLLHYARNAVLVAREGDVEGAYERLRLLGEGGAGRTWLARDRVRDQLVVLKEPLAQFHEDPLIIANVTREARMASRVRHPNVVRIHEVLSHQGRPVLVMEYAEGGSLAHLLRARGRLPPREAAAVAVQVLDGLAAVHDAGVVHRDVKPSNVLLTRDGVAKLADFGVAVSAASGKTVVLAEGAATTTRAGTVAYMAPELLDARSVGDVRSDLYACAALIHECLAGAPPGSFAGARLDDAVPAALRDAVARGLDPDPARRHASARAFRDAVARAVAP